MRKPLEPIYALTVVVVLSHISFGASRVLLTLYALSLDASTFVIGTLISIYSAAPLLLSVYAGRVSDRVGYRLPMLWGCVGLAVAMLAPYLVPGMASLYVSAVVAGGSFSVFNIAAQALAGALSTPQTRARNFSTLSMGYSVSSLVGPLVVGFSADLVGVVRAYAILAAIVLPPLVILAFKSKVYDQRGAGAGPGTRSVMDLLRNRGLAAMFIASGACVTGWDLFSFFMPIYGTSIGLSASRIGIIISTFGVATLVVRVFIPHLSRRYGDLRVLSAAMYLGAFAFALLPFFKSEAMLLVLSFVMGLGLGCGQPLTMMITYVRAPAGRAGEANGIRQMANNVTHLIVPMMFGALGAAVGMGPVFWTNGALLLVGGWVGGRRIDVSPAKGSGL